jgi:uncharacterized protein (DUF1015 family)
MVWFHSIAHGQNSSPTRLAYTNRGKKVWQDQKHNMAKVTKKRAMIRKSRRAISIRLETMEKQLHTVAVTICTQNETLAFGRIC